MPTERRKRSSIPITGPLIILTIGFWGAILSNQLTRIERLLQQRQVVIVPHHATMGGEAPTPIPGP